MAPPLLPITRLIACPACAEHFKSNESSCPHCGADNRSLDSSREGRAVRAATAVLMGLALSGCPDKEPDPTTTTDGTEGSGGSGSGSETSASTTGADSSGTTFTPEPEYGVPVTTSGPEPDYGVPGTDSTAGTGTTGMTGTGGEPLYGAGAT